MSLGFTPNDVDVLYRQAVAGDLDSALVWLDAAQEMGLHGPTYDDQVSALLIARWAAKKQVARADWHIGQMWRRSLEWGQSGYDPKVRERPPGIGAIGPWLIGRLLMTLEMVGDFKIPNVQGIYTAIYTKSVREDDRGHGYMVSADTGRRDALKIQLHSGHWFISGGYPSGRWFTSPFPSKQREKDTLNVFISIRGPKGVKGPNIYEPAPFDDPLHPGEWKYIHEPGRVIPFGDSLQPKAVRGYWRTETRD